MIIYKITNTITGQSYIGQTAKKIGVRFSQHKYEAIKRNRQDKLHSAMRKYGVDNFTCITIAKSVNYKQLANMERVYIKRYNTIEDGYNQMIRKDPGKHKVNNKTGGG